jgi:hypothetical protein
VLGRTGTIKLEGKAAIAADIVGPDRGIALPTPTPLATTRLRPAPEPVRPLVDQFPGLLTEWSFRRD